MPTISFKRTILYGKSEKIWSERIFDISSNGAAIRIPNEHRELFQIETQLQVEKIDTYKMGSDLYAKVSYLNQISVGKIQSQQIFFRVGLVFDRTINIEKYFYHALALV
ncbi:MAG: hypothetical protein ISR65_14145 [Bacteriovoracaceae bacterium]|nr:hypothetical protein [Bacteriovoracaceae bacterium]